MLAKCIALDLDGTLLTDSHTITPLTKQLLRECKKQGVLIVLATGRSSLSCMEIMDDLGFSGPVIAYNGGLTFHSASKQILQENSFFIDEIVPFVKLARKEKVEFHVSTAYSILVEHEKLATDERYNGKYIQAKQVEDVLQLEEKIYKMSLTGSKEKMNVVQRQMNFVNEKLEVIRSADRTIDIVHVNTNKGSALKKLAYSYQLSMEEVVSFGNYYNDTELLIEAGLGIAMENAPNEIKLISDRVTLSNNDNGVAVILEELLAKHASSPS